MPKSFLRACIRKIPEWGYGPHTLCCEQTSEFKHVSSLFQLQQSDLNHNPVPQVPVTCIPFKVGWKKEQSAATFGINQDEQLVLGLMGRLPVNMKYTTYLFLFLMNVDRKFTTRNGQVQIWALLYIVRNS